MRAASPHRVWRFAWGPVGAVRIGALALLFAWVSVGCKSGSEGASEPGAVPPPPRVVLTRLVVRDATPSNLRPAQVPIEHLEKVARDGLAAAGMTVSGEPSSDDWRAEARLTATYGLTKGQGLLAQPEAATARFVWGLELSFRQGEQPEANHAWLEGSHDRPWDSGEGVLAAALAGLAGDAFKPVTEGAKARLQVLRMTVPQLIERVNAAESDVRLAVLDRLAGERTREAAPAITARLSQERDRTVLLRMVGALAEIGDPVAADALIALADPKDRELLRAVVDALVMIGGARVDDFLSILGAHDAADVRELVEQARKRRAREQPLEPPGSAAHGP